MFGIDFSELMVILLVALVVIGPERLPKVARTLGLLWGRAQRYVHSVKADISRDMALDELKQLQQNVQKQASSVERAVTEATHKMDWEVEQISSSVAQSAADAPQPAPVSSQSPSDTPKQAQLELQAPAEQKKFPVD